MDIPEHQEPPGQNKCPGFPGAMGKLSRALWTENERKQLKCWCILTDTKSPSLLLNNSAKVIFTSKCQEAQFTVKSTIKQEQLHGSGTLEIRRAFTKQTTQNPDLLSKDSTHLEVHKKIFYQSPRRKGKECLLPGINVFTLALTWASSCDTQSSQGIHLQSLPDATLEVGNT